MLTVSLIENRRCSKQLAVAVRAHVISGNNLKIIKQLCVNLRLDCSTLQILKTLAAKMALVSASRLTEVTRIFLLAAISALFVVALVAYEIVRWSARVAGFKGPPGKPIVGNLLQIQHKDAPEQYRQWAKQYGPVYQIQLGNVPVLVINSAAAAKEILNRNSHATGSRPEFYTFHKVSSKYSTSVL